MFDLISGIASFSRLTGNSDDDWIDRMNHLWSVVLLALFAVVVTTSQFVGEAIHCWVPGEYDSHTSYINSICWISNTYFIEMEDQIPTEHAKRREQEIAYYQWVPLILLMMALLFKIPNIVWRMCNSYSGINLEKITRIAESTQLGSSEDRETSIKHIAIYMDRWLQSQRNYDHNIISRLRKKFSNVFCFWFGKREGTFLIGLYLFIKLLYCVNVVGQFFLLNAFMAMEYSAFGFEIMENVLSNKEWSSSYRFPRVTLCDFEKRVLANVHRVTVQCVLPVNLFNEKIFIFLWFWIFFVAIFTFLNYTSWLYHTLFVNNRPNFVKKYLRIANEIGNGLDKKVARRFAEEYLRADGVFVLRVVEKNSTSLVLTDLVRKLWKIFKDYSYDGDDDKKKEVFTITNVSHRGEKGSKEDLIK